MQKRQNESPHLVWSICFTYLIHFRSHLTSVTWTFSICGLISYEIPWTQHPYVVVIWITQEKASKTGYWFDLHLDCSPLMISSTFGMLYSKWSESILKGEIFAYNVILSNKWKKTFLRRKCTAHTELHSSFGIIPNYLEFWEFLM